ncbi:hypothetical protein IWW36_004051 [Coemansia brasiliensis]|uniref:LYR motif-containing protein Cup1-like N-terminal domain-containing protein n=1 Tax=Coemansia brasiliensis TaxID=2650707 RepID=A0A9W8I4A6_9FUNG|nr:hypothetical protein IWW36_004051 [Coemansia brasiliensis]
MPTRQEVMRLYRGLLKNARAFFDDTTREFIQTETKKLFRKNHNDIMLDRVHRKLNGARTTLHLLERANQHIFKDVLSVLGYGYGRKGPRKLVMLEATVGVEVREEIFGSVHDVEKYRPAFFALAKYQLGVDKLYVNKDTLRSNHPINVAKMQDEHWKKIRHQVLPPVDAATMDILEERASSGIVTSSAQYLNPEYAHVIKAWEERWVKFPERRQVRRFYRRLLESIDRMDVTTVMVPNPGKYLNEKARRTTEFAPGVEKPDLIPKKVYRFVKSPLAGKQQPENANIIDIAGMDTHGSVKI